MNYTHLMPTRYNLSDVDLKKVIAGDALESPEKKLSANKVRLCHNLMCLLQLLRAWGGSV